MTGWCVEVLGILFVLLTKTLPAKGVTTCDAPPVREGEAAAVTCTFSEDVRQTNRNIKVQRYPPDSKGFDPDTVVNVLDCHWFDSGQINCDTKEGYELTGEVGKQAVITIPRASRQNVGRYMCEVIPSEPDDIKSCQFFLKEQMDVADMSIKMGELSGQLEKLGSTLESGQDDMNSLLVAILCLIVLGILIIVAAVSLYVLRNRIKSHLPRCITSHMKNGADDNAEIEMKRQDIENAGTVDSAPTRPQVDEDHIKSVLSALGESGELLKLLKIENTRLAVPSERPSTFPAESTDRVARDEERDQATVGPSMSWNVSGRGESAQAGTDDEQKEISPMLAKDEAETIGEEISHPQSDKEKKPKKGGFFHRKSKEEKEIKKAKKKEKEKAKQAMKEEKKMSGKK